MVILLIRFSPRFKVRIIHGIAGLGPRSGSYIFRVQVQAQDLTWIGFRSKVRVILVIGFRFNVRVILGIGFRSNVRVIIWIGFRSKVRVIHMVLGSGPMSRS